MASAYLSVFSRTTAARMPFGSQAFICRTNATQGLAQRAQSAFHTASTVQSAVARQAVRPRGMGWGVAGAVTLGLGISAFSSRNSVYCEPGSRAGTPAPAAPPKGAAANDGFPDAPKSNINLYELSFGSVCGVCAGVFVKKGAKALAFMLGGVFVLLQYLGSASIVKVDWTKAGNRFERLFYRTDASGVRHPPNVGSLWRWLVDFLTADFQPRASFIAGFALGIRIG